MDHSETRNKTKNSKLTKFLIYYMFSEFLHTHRLILYPPADAPAAVVSITQTMIQNSRLQNASWYVLKLANPDDFVT